MEKHIKVARVHRALALLYGLLATLVLGLLLSLSEPTKPIGMYLLVLLMAGLATLHFAVARGAREGRNGARIASLIIAVLMLPAFPLGTLIGVYLLVNAANAWDDMEAAGH